MRRAAGRGGRRGCVPRRAAGRARRGSAQCTSSSGRTSGCVAASVTRSWSIRCVMVDPPAISMPSRPRASTAAGRDGSPPPPGARAVPRPRPVWRRLAQVVAPPDQDKRALVRRLAADCLGERGTADARLPADEDQRPAPGQRGGEGVARMDCSRSRPTRGWAASAEGVRVGRPSANSRCGSMESVPPSIARASRNVAFCVAEQDDVRGSRCGGQQGSFPAVAGKVARRGSVWRRDPLPLHQRVRGFKSSAAHPFSLL